MHFHSRGACHALFAYDVAFSIDLSRAEIQIREGTQRETLRHRRRAPKYFRYEPAPVRFTRTGEALSIAGFQTNRAVDHVLYDFGAVSVTYTIPFDGPFSSLLALSGALYDNALLLEDSRRRVQELVHAIEPALTRPSISAFVEDYAVFLIEGFDPAIPLSELGERYAPDLAQILRAESRPLSDEEIRDALAHRIAFSREDLTIVDWNAAVVIDREPEDILAVLEFANVELMEMRYLDHRLDNALELAYDALSRQPRRSVFPPNPAELRRVAQWQVDSAMLFEGVNNALKLLGDQYLARLYRVTAERFHLAEWDATIIRKLETLDSIYGKISDQLASRRMEILEWIIIILIAISIVLPFFVSYGG